MVNYYGKFLPNLVTKLSPLYKLLRQTSEWHWGPRQKKAFWHIKKLLKSNRVLTHFNDQLPLILECDASPYGLGAVLSHQMLDGSEKPVGFASRTLTKAEQNYSHLDKEAGRSTTSTSTVITSTFELTTNLSPTYSVSQEQSLLWPLDGSRGGLSLWERTTTAYASSRARLMQTQTLESVAITSPRSLVHLMEHLETTPLSSTQIKSWTDTDPILSRVRCWVQEGWPERDAGSESDTELAPYFRRRWELGVEGVVWCGVPGGGSGEGSW